jgi:thiamine-monophosphate kinase
LLNLKKLKKSYFISQGDDYQILFTASPRKSEIITKTSKFLGIKISKIGKITSHIHKSEIIDQKGKKIPTKTKGYYHRF